MRFLNNEREPEQLELRKVIYDIYCLTDTGEHIIVEMQNRRQDHFKECGLFYLSRSIVNQRLRGDWNFQLDAVYGVFFANFYLDGREAGRFRKDVGLMDMETGELFCDKLRQIYIELPAFNKTEEECETDFERWIYVLKNMEIMERMPFKARKAVFDRLEQIASKANMSVEERHQYETEWKIYNDYFNTLDSAKREGHAEGRLQGMMETARNLKSMGVEAEIIMRATGLTAEEIEKL